VNLGTTPPADAGVILKELEVLGWKGVKVAEVGTGADALRATGGVAADGVIMGAAVILDGSTVPEHARKVNEEARAVLGESLNMIQVGAYDAVFALKAAMEKAQSVESKAVAAALPKVRFTSFYGTAAGFGRADEYGSPQQLLLPVFITRVENGKLVGMARIDPRLE
jgi:branched-chain amino acid transport system substrate-binding protein